MTRGLSSTEAAARLARDGPNATPRARGPSLAARVAHQFRDALVRLLIAAVVLDAAVWYFEGATGWPVEAISIVAILVVNAGLGLAQELRSERALERLEALGAPWVFALRDGEVVRVATHALVTGDLVRLEAGDRVPADVRSGPGAGFLVDESLLTGESVPVARTGGEEIAAGVLLVRGAGFVEVVRTGPRSALGRLAGLIGATETSATPLERRMRRFGGRVTAAVIAVAIAFVALGLALEGTSHLVSTIVVAVALAVAAVPEGLPAVITFSLAIGVERMAEERAIVRRLSAVEALGSVTVVATDKTGTLTENRLVVHAVEGDDEAATVRALVLANDAEDDGVAGDPLDLALLAWAKGLGVDADEVRGACPRTSSRPFDARDMSMRVTVREGGALVSYVKGAPEAVLRNCALDAASRAEWLARAETRAHAGFRVLAVARGGGETEDGLEPLGLALLWDPPRAAAEVAVRRARGAGIRVLMVTGDHPATARAVARQVGIDDGGVVTGAEFAALDASAAGAAAESSAVFARFAPEQKLRLVEVLQQRGEIVAMTGDGVNDAPALKRSDVGVAMGLRGSDVAREVADLVLLDDDFATIVTAIEEGRLIFGNVRTFVRFLFATNVSELAILVIGFPLAFAMGLREADGTVLLPLTAAQILWINLVTDGLPAFALAFDRRAGVLDVPPRPAQSPLFDRDDLVFLTIVGAVSAALGMGLLEVSRRLGLEPAAARTVLFVFLTVTQLGVVFAARRQDSVPERNRVLVTAVAAGLALVAASLFVPPLRLLLGCAFPGWTALASACAAALLPCVAAFALASRHRKAVPRDVR